MDEERLHAAETARPEAPDGGSGGTAPPPEPAAEPAKPPAWAKLPGEPVKKPFVIRPADRVFALAFYLVGYLYLRLVIDHLLDGRQWTVGLFAAVYAAAVLTYLLVKGVKPPAFSWFWLAVLLALGASFALWRNESLLGFDWLALHGVALYWPLCAAGAALRPETSSLLPADLCNAAIVTPFGNFFAQLRCIFGGWRVRKEGAGRRTLAVLLGLGALLALLLLILPLLIRADEQFALVMKGVWNLLRFDWDAELVLAAPVGLYLFGLAYGLANRRHTDHIRAERLAELGGDVRVLPDTTVYIVLGGVCLVYVLFIGVQARSLFSAFAGRLSGTAVYSEFAREGFFELCRVAAINGAILLGANLLAGTERLKSRALRALNGAMAGLTLLILASAARKMLLYIQVYGLTPKRVLTMAFMAMLAVLFGGAAVWQRRRFNLIRVAVCFAAVLFCALALCNLDALIAAYNAAHGLLV